MTPADEMDGAQMTRRQLLDEAMTLSHQLLALADHENGDGDAEECLMLEGVLRDSAFKIRKVAERLRQEPEIR